MMLWTRKTVAGLLLVSGLVSLWGCGGTQATKAFLRKEVDLGYVQTVAVLPFEGSGGDQVREITITEVLAAGLFDVVDKGRVDAALKEEALEKGQTIDPASMKRLGQRLRVQAFVLGSVEQGSGDARAGAATYPEVTVTLRLVDSEAGLLLWQASGRGSGYSVTDRLFGVGAKNSFEVTLELLDRMLATLRRRAPS